MKKVLCIIESLGSGGAERQIAHLAVQLVNSAYDVEVAYYRKLEFYLSYLKENHVKASFLVAARNPKVRFFALWRYIRETKPDVIISYSATPSMITCLLKFLGGRFKLVVSERSTTQQLGSREKLKFFLYKWADYIVPNSQSQGNFIKQYFPKLVQKTCVIHNYIDTEKFKPSPVSHLEHEGTRMICVGRMMAPKNVIRFIHAINKVLADGYKIHVDWFGKDLKDAYSKEVNAALLNLRLGDSFVFHEASPNIQDEYIRADVFCLPSIYEGFPNVLCEAMSCAIPVICSNVCDNPYIVTEKENGLLFNPLDIDDIATAIEHFIDLPKEQKNKMAKTNRETALRMFSGRKFIDSYLRIIDNDYYYEKTE